MNIQAKISIEHQSNGIVCFLPNKITYYQVLVPRLEMKYLIPIIDIPNRLTRKRSLNLAFPAQVPTVLSLEQPTSPHISSSVNIEQNPTELHLSTALEPNSTSQKTVS